MANIGPMQLLIIFLIVLLIFGTKKLRNVGGDLGSAIRDFRKGMSSDEEAEDPKPEQMSDQDQEHDKDTTAAQSTSAESPEADSSQPKP